ncbi:MAG: NERD domain-containing protein [Bacillota bacterium]|uniref:NERD domain-containing protein n=2 Tax=Virgibacillus TaxID=84406 RepID=UPI00041EF35C|nr:MULTISPECIES: NERD domain-containing protein [unclassified Virgibacillus]MCC2252455.1 NERD domain-containing protein [Virgibacillus sp. AGTR]MDY7045473.1 NERD domain-containing protein [Virgibacillus sp. M23]QRZ16318.1 NERD domain-containing protein [Virgibacillus sp. AGTR]
MNRFLVMKEVKNIKEPVIFNDSGQVIRVTDDMEQVLRNPIDQINLQHLCLLRWLRQFNLPSIPLEKLVVYSNANTILKNLTNKSAITKIVIHKERLIERIDKLQARYSKKCFTETDLLYLSFQFILPKRSMLCRCMEYMLMNERCPMPKL